MLKDISKSMFKKKRKWSLNAPWKYKCEGHPKIVILRTTLNQMLYVNLSSKNDEINGKVKVILTSKVKGRCGIKSWKNIGNWKYLKNEI